MRGDEAEKGKGRMSRRRLIAGFGALAVGTLAPRRLGRADRDRALEEAEIVGRLTGMRNFYDGYRAKVKVPGMLGGRWIVHVRTMHKDLRHMTSDMTKEVAAAEYALRPLREALARANKLDGIYLEAQTTDAKAPEGAIVKYVFAAEEPEPHRRGVEAALRKREIHELRRDGRISHAEWQRLRERAEQEQYDERDRIAVGKVHARDLQRESEGLPVGVSVIEFGGEHDFTRAVEELDERLPEDKRYGLIEMWSKDLNRERRY